jgi:hypothetical protein
MNLQEWQVSLISVIIGTVIGAIIPLVYVYFREIRSEKKRKEEIQRILCAELELVRETLVQSLKKESDEKNHKIFISPEMPFYDSFPLDTIFYDDLTIEVLSKNVTIEAIKNLQITYNAIYRFNERSIINNVTGRTIIKKDALVLISQINETLKLVKDEKE